MKSPEKAVKIAPKSNLPNSEQLKTPKPQNSNSPDVKSEPLGGKPEDKSEIFEVAFDDSDNEEPNFEVINITTNRTEQIEIVPDSPDIGNVTFDL